MARGAHKVNPVGFRIGVNKNWKSRWYADKKSYADNFLVDTKIRKHIETKLKSAGVASIIIKRSINKVLVEISVARPGVVIGKGGSAINELKEEVSKIAGTETDIKIFEVKNPEIIAKIVAESIAMQVEKRINPKVAMERAIKAARETGQIEGIAIWVGGRIKGAEMARVEKEKWGNIPRHTLRKNLDYAFAEGHYPRGGIHGIKVWINKGEKNTYQID